LICCIKKDGYHQTATSFDKRAKQKKNADRIKSHRPDGFQYKKIRERIEKIVTKEIYFCKRSWKRIRWPSDEQQENSPKEQQAYRFSKQISR